MWGDPKGNAVLKNPKSLRPPPTPHAAGVWWAQILPFQHADAAISGHTEGHLPRCPWWKGSWCVDGLSVRLVHFEKAGDLSEKLGLSLA